MKYWVLDKIFNKPAAKRQIEYLAIDRNFHILDLSERAQRFAEFPEEVKLGKDVREGFPELVGVEDILLAILDGEEESFEYKRISRYNDNNSAIYINLYVIGDEDEKELNKKLFIFLEDDTEKILLEQTLIQRTNEAELLLSKLSVANNYIKQIIASMADALIVTNRSGKIETVNKAAESLFEYSEDELIGQPLAKIIADDELLRQLTQEYPLSPGELLKDIEVVCHNKSGKSFFVAFSCSSIQTEIKGVQDFIYIGRDITDRQRMEKRLLAQYVTSRIISESTTLEEVIPKILLAVCESLGWNLGELWMPEKANDGDLLTQNSKLKTQNFPTSQPPSSNFQLRCVEIWSRPSPVVSEFIRVTKANTFASGVGLPGRIWATGSPQWIVDAIEDPNYLRSHLAKQAGLHTAFGFPIQSGREVLGVIIFYSRSRQEVDEDLMQMMVAVGNQLGQFIKRKRTEEALRYQQEQTERLLLNILPGPIAERLKNEETTIAENFAEVTVMFADIVGFTELSTRLSATELVKILNRIFSEFDYLAEKHGLEKIKTIGDAYMVVGGLPVPQTDRAVAIAEMAIDMQAAITEFSYDNGQSLDMRIGINTGPVVAGVIGTKKFTYDLWGDTVNIASRMESHGMPGRIHVSEATYQYLRDRYLFEERGEIQVKGKGTMTTYFLIGRKSQW